MVALSARARRDHAPVLPQCTCVRRTAIRADGGDVAGRREGSPREEEQQHGAPNAWRASQGVASDHHLALSSQGRFRLSASNICVCCKVYPCLPSALQRLAFPNLPGAPHLCRICSFVTSQLEVCRTGELDGHERLRSLRRTCKNTLRITP